MRIEITTKITMSDAVMRCCVVLAILLMGVPCSHGQCHQKASECSTSVGTMITSVTPLVTSSPPDVTALETACSSARQSVTNCVTEAKAACAEQPDIIASMDALITSLDTYCGPTFICQLRATACQAPLLAVLPTGPPPSDSSGGTDSIEMMQKVCPAYQEVLVCLQELSSSEQCGNDGLVQNITASVQLAASSCSILGGGGTSGGGLNVTGGVCLESFGCFSSFFSASGERCAATETVVQCLSGLKDTCNLDESKVTFTQLQSLVNSLCIEMSEFPAVYQNCSAVEQCVMTNPVLGLTDLVSSSNLDISSISTILSNVTNPVWLCGYLQVSVDCTLSQAQVCQYSQQYVEAMTQQQRSLQQSCSNPATTPTATTGAPRAEHHDVLCGPTSMSFKIPVPALVADNQTLAQTMTLSDPRCRVDVVSSRLTGSTSLNDCGTTLEVTNDSLVFSNAILLPAANDSGVTSLIPIQCRYDRLANLTVSAYLPVVRQVLFTETGVGQLSFRINQYRDATFSSRVADSAYPLRLHSSDDVFVELALGGDQQLEGLGMDVLGCMALPSSSPAAADAGGVYENLIENNCPASPEVRLLNDHLPAASQNHSLFRFSFKALTFPDPADPQRSRTGVVYIHCRVKLCKSSECRSEGQCPSFSALSRSKRAVGRLAEGSAGHQLSTGPLLVDGDSSESNASSPLVVFLGVVAACATLVAMVATVAWRRSRRRGDLQRLDKVTADLQ